MKAVPRESIVIYGAGQIRAFLLERGMVVA